MSNILIAVISILVLIKAADVFVDHASALAKKLKISGFIIGFTFVAFGTSLPELVVSTYSTLSGHETLAISNVLGSNIANLCLILGITALIKEYQLTKEDVHVNFPLNLVALGFVILSVAAFGFKMPWLLGIVFVLLLVFIVHFSRNRNGISTIICKTSFNPLLFILSLTFVIVAGKVGVDAVVALANQLGIAESILGFFLLALGTSLPEFITSITAVRKGNSSLGVGSILGSNLFNLLFILSVSSFIKELDFSGFFYEIIFLMIITFMAVVFALVGKRYHFTKVEGLGMLGLYGISILVLTL